MPRLPTILVIGSHDISLTSDSCAVVIAVPFPSKWARRPAPGRTASPCQSPGLLVAGQELGALLAPLRLLVRGLGGEAAQGADDRPVHAGRGGGNLRSRRLVHERHELVREAGHRAGDADAAPVRAAAHPVDPAALGY